VRSRDLSPLELTPATHPTTPMPPANSAASGRAEVPESSGGGLLALQQDPCRSLTAQIRGPSASSLTRWWRLRRRLESCGGQLLSLVRCRENHLKTCGRARPEPGALLYAVLLLRRLGESKVVTDDCGRSEPALMASGGMEELQRQLARSSGAFSPCIPGRNARAGVHCRGPDRRSRRRTGRLQPPERAQPDG
jgi:hypothetical protein